MAENSFVEVVTLDGVPCEVFVKNNKKYLCYQYCEWSHPTTDGTTYEYGYRFIERKGPNTTRRPGTCIPATGGAIIPSFHKQQQLITMAVKKGWVMHCEERVDQDRYDTISLAESWKRINKGAK